MFDDAPANLPTGDAPVTPPIEPPQSQPTPPPLAPPQEVGSLEMPITPEPPPIAPPATPVVAEDMFAGMDTNDGAPTQPPMQSPLPTGKSGGGGGKIALVIVIVVIVVGIAAGAAYYFFAMRSSDATPSPTSPIEASEEPVVAEEVEEPEVEEVVEPVVELDSDGDGLTDAQEAKLGTSTRKPDTDSDGLFDRDEVEVYFTNPLNPDTDGDTFSDGDEVRNGYNPNGEGRLRDIPKK